MQRPRKSYLLELTVFLCGAIVMTLELTASRVLAPLVGTSIVIWSVLISIVLGGLSLGYWLGGLLADKKPTIEKLSLIVLLAGLLIGIIPLLQLPLFEFLSTLPISIISQTTVATCILFLVPSILLGMVSPYATKLTLTSLATTGRTVGKLSAFSTLGSITGTLFTGLYLMVVLGNREILYLLASSLVILSVIIWRGRFFVIKLFIFLDIIGLLVYQNMLPLSSHVLIEQNTHYSYAKVFDNSAGGDTVRILQLNKDFHSGMYMNRDELAFNYTKFYNLGKYFTPYQSSALILGGGAYSWPKEFLIQYPQATVDVVEIDPAVTSLAKKYFKLTESPQMHVYHEDARTYLNKNEKKYDAVYADVYQSNYSVPYQLTTKEALELVRRALNDNGVFIVNVIGALEGKHSLFARSEYKTLKAVFPEVKVFPTYSLSDLSEVQNIIFVAGNDLKSSDLTEHEDVRGYFQMEYVGEINTDVPWLTDNFAPVDQFIASLFW